MPEPISARTSNTSYARDESSASTCNPDTQSCGPPASSTTRAQTITLEPVVVTGDLGVQALVEQHSRASRLPPDCDKEFAETRQTCEAALTGVAASTAPVATAAPPLAIAGLAINAFNAGRECGKAIASYTYCVDKNALHERNVAECKANGGVPAQGASADELLCFVRP